jgi:gamma-F420-2:alpha-L-glutamate ligase
MKKILLFSQATKTDYSVKRFLDEAKNLNIHLDHSDYINLEQSFGHNGFTLETKELGNFIDNYDAFILRSSKTKYGTEYKHLSSAIRYLAKSRGKYVFNADFSINSQTPKINNYFIMANNDIPLVPTYILNNMAQLFEKKDKLEYPLIAKSAKGSHGLGVTLIHNFKDLCDYFANNLISQTLIQKFLDTDSEFRSDIRIVTLGDKILGGFKRVVSRENITTNIAAGGRGEQIELDDKLIDIAHKVIKAFNAEYSGIDIMYDKDQPVVLEVNNSPQFEGFEKTTGVNVAKTMLEYIISKI